MNYEETINYIHSIPKFRRPLGNENLARLLGLLGNPQKKLRFVHIAGTNGKGSAAAMTAEILKRAGYKTGLFTSPFIEVFNERICVCGKNIPDNLLIEYTERVKNIMETSGALVSEFAFVTAVAFLYFYEQKCDFVVLEVGMGGSLDATNVIDNSVVSVIMKIALDHTQYLGDTIEEIT
ncbi:MAG: bifunctional folylpolyglutamate synthase/dihydrofolate synthase, partial [Clostridia bacterium]|nr:bifunctional folylpolyglutamate synthase/dihydrofolate synthase [Clostridia bacterium]